MTALPILAMCVALMAGCATPGGNGDAAAFNSSPGAVAIMGDVNITKQFIGCDGQMRSGFDTGQDSQSQQGGSVGVNVATQTGSLDAQAGAALVSSLAALDECGEATVEKEKPDGDS